MDFGLNGRAVLVTGGSRGIGRVIARAFAKEGARIAITYRSRIAEAKDAIHTLTADGAASVDIFQMNLRSPISIENSFVEIDRQRLSIDVLINNAVAWPLRGPGTAPEFSELPVAEWRDTIRANIEGTYLVTQLASRYMRNAGWGRIVNVSSIAADGLPNGAAYAVAKSATDGLTMTLAAELSPFNILTNAVAPCLIVEPSDSAEAASRSGNSPGVMAPSDVPPLVVLLSSPLNTAINGQVIRLGVNTFLPRFHVSAK